MILKWNAAFLKRFGNTQVEKPGASGQTDAANIANAISRNHPCPCGSGRKYKHCCGAYVGGVEH